jgi:phosphate/sulfate permease
VIERHIGVSQQEVGIGAVTRQAQWRTIAKILIAWVTTLPTGAALGALSYRLVASF